MRHLVLLSIFTLAVYCKQRSLGEKDEDYTNDLLDGFNADRKNRPLLADKKLIINSEMTLRNLSFNEEPEPYKWVELGNGFLFIRDDGTLMGHSNTDDSQKFTEAFMRSKEVWKSHRLYDNQVEWGPYEQLIMPTTTHVGCEKDQHGDTLYVVCQFEEPRQFMTTTTDETEVTTTTMITSTTTTTTRSTIFEMTGFQNAIEGQKDDKEPAVTDEVKDLLFYVFLAQIIASLCILFIFTMLVLFIAMEKECMFR